MKELRLFLALLLAPLAFQAALADDADDVARAAMRRNTQSVVQSSRQKTNSADKPITKKGTTASRSNNIDTKKTSVRERVASSSRSDAGAKQVTARTTTQRVQTRPSSTDVQKTVSRTPAASRTNTVASRVATTARTAAISRGDNTARTTKKSDSQRLSRTAMLARTGSDLTASDIISRDYKKCREVFYNCMDEFCANKDSQLRRCACSSRINEFDGTKQRLAQVEDKLLDFSQRLLTVNMDAEDAAALNQATEGELAFYESGDESTSKKMLDEIAKKLNTSFDDSQFNQGLNAISLSLNTGAAFDQVDSMFGASATTKSGTELHAAALPVCREMAAEVCTPEELSIAEGGYQVMIEQDCNTVAKSYETQSEQARKQILESSALLDISRLDIHQKRNSDDVLTCKKKMLTMLTDSTVCGTDMVKCLDMTGQYIDPSTGDAFLTDNLANLGNLLTRPVADQSWHDVAGNEQFVSFLDSKKKFLEPAMENCQDISDYVWDVFIEDALAQIKLAQDAKLEDVRQSCTTLTTQCLDKALTSISEYDARALSIFGISADMTANAMCEDVKNACTALLDTIGTDDGWGDAMDNIASDKSYETILATCREVGKNCIIQNCKSTAGNFGLCESISLSVNRSSIVNRSACWGELYNCVNAAGAENVAQILRNRGRVDEDGGFTSFMGELYNGGAKVPYNYCEDVAQCATDNTTPECAVCRITEQLWGNCTAGANSSSGSEIIDMDKGDPNETLLSWFARNTGTVDAKNSCSDTSCANGYTRIGDACYLNTTQSTFNGFCKTIVVDNTKDRVVSFDLTEDDPVLSDCCPWGTHRTTYQGHCCRNGHGNPRVNEYYFKTSSAMDNVDNKDSKGETQICVPLANYVKDKLVNTDAAGSISYVYTVLATPEYTIYCTSNEESPLGFESDDNGNTKITCNNGYFIKVLANGYTTLLSEPGPSDNNKMQAVNAVGLKINGTYAQTYENGWYHEVSEEGNINYNNDDIPLCHWTISFDKKTTSTGQSDG